MESSYAVKWRESSGHLFLGRLDVGPTALMLEGRDGVEDAVMRTLDFEELDGFHLAQSTGERIDGRPTLVVEHAGGELLVTTAVVHAGVLPELVHRLSELRLLALARSLDLVPLVEEPSAGAAERASLVARAHPRKPGAVVPPAWWPA